MVEKTLARAPSRFLVAICIMTVFVLIFAPRKSVSVFSDPPVGGDWVVTGTESYYDEVFVLDGNLIVEDGGNLTFRKVTLKMNCAYDGQYNITVKPGGKFYVLDGSVITSANPDKRYMFSAWSTFRMNNSEIHECGWNDEPEGWGLEIICDDAIVENSLLSHSFRGINIGSDGVVVRNNKITENDHHGVFVWDGSPIICDNNISLNNVSGIEFFSSPTIRNNTITSNGAGILFGNEADPIIQDNIITFNNDSGIAGQFCSPVIQGNIISNNGYGIVLKGDIQGIIQRNVIMNNSDCGIHFGDNVSLLIQENVITSNKGSGILCQNDVQSEVHWNDIYGNYEFDIATENDPSVYVNATYNYWRDGPDPEKISGNVLYDPWLTESIFSAKSSAHFQAKHFHQR